MAPTTILSGRMESTISAILPQITASLSQRSSEALPNIDLAAAENWVIRPGLVALCKDAIAEDLVAQVIPTSSVDRPTYRPYLQADLLG